MKNNWRLFIIAICCLALVGCESRGFKAERQMWRANQLARTIYANPKGTPPFQFDRAQDAYREIIQKYPNTFFSVQAQFNIGHLYLARGDFQKARLEYEKLIADCGQKENLCADATFAVGYTFEAQGQWDEALSYYRKIMQTYPFSAKSLDLPFYAIRHYRQASDPVAVRRSVDESVAHFLSLKTKKEGQKGEFALQGLVARSYIEGEQWQDALDAFDKLIRDYPENNPEQMLWAKALIYSQKLRDRPRAKEELQKIVQGYPQSKLAKIAEALLKKL